MVKKADIKFNGHWEFIDGKCHFIVNSPQYAIIELKDFIGKETRGLATEKPFSLRTNDQNRLYWAGIVRQVMALHKERGEIWTDGECHEYNLIKVFGVRPTLIVKGSIVFESWSAGINKEFLALKLKERGHDPEILVNVKPKSSQFDTIMFTLLIEMCRQHYAEVFGYDLKFLVDEQPSASQRAADKFKSRTKSSGLTDR